MKCGDVTYEELLGRLNTHGFNETKSRIVNKLTRATVSAVFFLPYLAAFELQGIRSKAIAI
ncbi:MAG: DUF6471 domain-containing protein [Methylovirgula sp.]